MARIAGINIPVNKHVWVGLMHIYGIGRSRALAVCKAANVAPSTRVQPNSAAGTPLRIPYGNKDVAMKLGARYGSAGWYAPPGVDLSEFGERGWL